MRHHDHSDRSKSALVAVVIGGGGGIGRALAEEFGDAGFRLALIDHDPGRLTEAVAQLAPRISVKSYACDITSDSSADQIVRDVLRDFGRVDLLVHAAGLTQVSLAKETRVDVYRRVMDVNFLGVVRMTQLFLPKLIETQGQIVALSSICGFAPLVGRTGYCASKYALHGYFETLRIEVKKAGVTVLIVCPSFVETDFATRGLAGDGSPLPFARSTLGKPLQPKQIAREVRHACKRNQHLLIFSWRGKLTYWLTRFAPAWYGRLMAKSFRIELERENSSSLSPPT